MKNGRRRSFCALGIAGVIGVGALGGCAIITRISGTETVMSEKIDNESAAAAGHLTLNRMNQAYGIGGTAPVGGDWPDLSPDWYLNVPATDAERPPAYPSVDYQDKSFFDMRDAERARLEEALTDVQERTGIGPWQLDAEGGTGCGPRDPRTRTGRNIGAAVTYTFIAHAEASDEQFEEVVQVLEEHYPGLTEPGNVLREYDSAERRTWDMASTRDDFLAVSRIVGQNRVVLTFQSACFVTRDNLEPPASMKRRSDSN